MYKIYEIEDTDKYYPQNLLKYAKHPKKIYLIGNKKILNNRCVVIVGSRDNTSYGEYYASFFAKELAKIGITVVSGLAVGIDTIAHKNSLNEKGKTIAVIGSGFNNIYPKENTELVKQIIKNGGAIISEYPPDTEVDLSNFPKRNRIIAGLGKCTIVVEAKFRSGSSITAKFTKEQGKPVFCIPGKIGTKTSVGTNNLIKKGAFILTDINQVLEIYGKQRLKSLDIARQGISKIKIQKKYLEIYKLINKTQVSINEIAITLNMDISEVTTKISMMELDGLIEILPGNVIKIKE